MARDRGALLALAALICAGCSSAPEAAETASETRLGSNGVVEFVASSDGALVEGDNRFAIEMRHVDSDEPLAGAELQAETVMRSMGHEAAGSPRVAEVGDGRYRVEEVVFSMPGLWELRLAVSKGDLHDEVGFLFEVP